MFESSFQFTLHYHTATNNNIIVFVIAIVAGEVTMLILQKYGFKACVIFFGLYSTRYNVYIHIPCVNTERQTKAPLHITHIISSSNRQTTRLYQGSADRCEGDCNSNIFHLLQPSQTIYCCNQSVLAILPGLNIFI